MGCAQSWSTLSLGQKCPLQPHLCHGVVLSWCFHHLHCQKHCCNCNLHLHTQALHLPGPQSIFEIGNEEISLPSKAALPALGFSQQGTRDEGTCEAEPTESYLWRKGVVLVYGCCGISEKAEP